GTDGSDRAAAGAAGGAAGARVGKFVSSSPRGAANVARRIVEVPALLAVRLVQCGHDRRGKGATRVRRFHVGQGRSRVGGKEKTHQDACSWRARSSGWSH